MGLLHRSQKYSCTGVSILVTHGSDFSIPGQSYPVTPKLLSKGKSYTEAGHVCVKWTFSSLSLHLFSFKGHYFLLNSSFLSFFLLFIFLIPLFFPFFYYSSPSPSPCFILFLAFPIRVGDKLTLSILIVIFSALSRPCLKKRGFLGSRENHIP